MAGQFPPELLDQAHANYRDFYRSLAVATPRGAYDEIDGLALISSGLQLADINLAIALRPAADPAVSVTHVAAFYRQQGVPWRLVAPDEVAARLDAAAAGAGMRSDHIEPGMLLAPIPRTAPLELTGLTKYRVVDIAGLRAFATTAAGPLETTPDLFATVLDPAVLALPELTLYLGIINGTPVATAACFIKHGIAGIYCIATHPAHRRRGLASALTWRAAQDGLTVGCDASCLQAWPMAVNLYTRLGYRHAVTYRTWSPQSLP